MGDASCWIGGYSYEKCCGNLDGVGNVECWDSVFNYSRCCFAQAKVEVNAGMVPATLLAMLFGYIVYQVIRGSDKNNTDKDRLAREREQAIARQLEFLNLRPVATTPLELVQENTPGTPEARVMRERRRQFPRKNLQQYSLLELLPPENIATILGCLDIQSLARVEVACRWEGWARSPNSRFSGGNLPTSAPSLDNIWRVVYMQPLRGGVLKLAGTAKLRSADSWKHEYFVRCHDHETVLNLSKL